MTEQTQDPPQPEFDLGVLFVHGIGDQARGATLVHFGTPIFEWLEHRARQCGAEVTLQYASLTPVDNDPPSTGLTIHRGESVRRWCLAETWWAESFAIRPFADVARWMLSAVPWTFGSHFGRRLWRAWAAPTGGTAARALWAARVTAATLALLGGIGLSVLMLVLLSCLLVIGLIPWERLRTSIQRVQVRLAATIGDSYILVSRPIEAAAIRARFHRDVEWLARRCARVAVVAHSQGGAVATLVLDAAPVERVNLLLTFGSGLRKLEELKFLRRSRNFQLSAALTMGGLLTVMVVALATVSLLLGPEREWSAWGELGMIVGCGAAGMLLLVCGMRDFAVAPEPAGLRKLGARFRERNVVWRDVFASADPVSNGRAHDGVDLPPETTEVVNRASMFSDHTSYWENRDEFVSVVCEALLDCDAPRALEPLPGAVMRYAAKRRRRRVGLLTVAQWLGIVCIGSVLVRYAADWPAPLWWAATFVADRIAALFGGDVIVSPFPSSATWGKSAGLLLLMSLLFVLTRAVWLRWDRIETREPPPLKHEGLAYLMFPVTILLQLLVVGVAWNGGDSPASWYIYAVFAAVLAMTALPIATMRAPAGPVVARMEDIDPPTNAVKAGNFILFVFRIGLFLVVLPITIFEFIGFMRGILSRWLGSPDVGWALSAIVTIGVVLLVFLALGGVIMLVQARRSAAAKRTSA